MKITINENQLKQIVLESVKRIIKESLGKINPRVCIPKVRGGWTEKKILNYLKNYSSYSGLHSSARFIAEFDDVNEFRSHLFWHGSRYIQSKLKPSITFGRYWDENNGGGGYGDRYWGVSITSHKQTASIFSTGRGVYVHPIILAKNAIVKYTPEYTDSCEICEDVLIGLYTEGVDAVRLGSRSEDEVVVINPRAICNCDEAFEYFQYYGLNMNSIKEPTDEQLQAILDACKEYVEAYKTKPQKPLKPSKPSRFVNDGSYEMLSDEEYNEKLSEYEKELSDYEKRLDAFNHSEEKLAWDKRQQALINLMRHKESVNENFNVTRIRITWLADMGRNKEMIMNNLLRLRKARNVGDEEVVNNTVLSALRRYPSYIQFEVIG